MEVSSETRSKTYNDSLTEIIKKEPVAPGPANSEDDGFNNDEKTFHSIKQEFYSKPELNLDWDEKYNIDGVDDGHVNGGCNIFSKLYNPQVLLERLPDYVFAKYYKIKNIGLKIENLDDTKEKSHELPENVVSEPEGEKKTLRINNLTVKKGTLQCGRALKSLRALRSDANRYKKQTVTDFKIYQSKTKDKNGLHKNIKRVCSKNIKVCSKRNKAVQYSKKHSIDSGKNVHCEQCSFKTRWKISLQKHIRNKHSRNLIGSSSKCYQKFKHQRSSIKRLGQGNGNVNAISAKVKDVILSLACSKCGKRYQNRQSLTRHLYLCRKAPHIQCDYCSYKTNMKDSMRKHILAMHLEKNVNYFLPCSKCGRRYKNQQSLTRHLYFCGEAPYIQCDYCSYKTNMKNSMRKHILAMHLEKNVNYFLPCSKCGKRCKNHITLIRHKSLCGKKPRLHCDYCSYRAKLKSTLKNHITMVHLEQNVHYFLPCPKCSKTFKNQSSLSRHSYYCGLKTHFECEDCSYKTNMKSSLKNHIIAKHLEKDVNNFLPCSKCGKRYKNQQALSQHESLCGVEPHIKCDYCTHKTNRKKSIEKHILAVHLEKNVNYFLPCSKCGKRYKNHFSLIRHKSLCGKKPHLHCDYCSYKSNLKGSMKKHIIMVHLEQNVNYFLPCSKCGKRFKNHYSLNRHKSLCGKKPHLHCDYCSHRTKLKSSLMKHILRVHLEHNVNHFLPCSRCSKTFKNQSSLSRHLYYCGLKTHFECEDCSYKTNIKSSLQKHIIAKHLEKDINYFLPCRNCGKTYKNENTLKSHTRICGKKPHLKCEHCSHFSIQKNDLAKHIFSVHKKKKY